MDVNEWWVNYRPLNYETNFGKSFLRFVKGYRELKKDLRVVLEWEKEVSKHPDLAKYGVAAFIEAEKLNVPLTRPFDALRLVPYIKGIDIISAMDASAGAINRSASSVCNVLCLAVAACIQRTRSCSVILSNLPSLSDVRNMEKDKIFELYTNVTDALIINLRSSEQCENTIITKAGRFLSLIIPEWKVINKIVSSMGPAAIKHMATDVFDFNWCEHELDNVSRAVSKIHDLLRLFERDRQVMKYIPFPQKDVLLRQSPASMFPLWLRTVEGEFKEHSLNVYIKYVELDYFRNRLNNLFVQVRKNDLQALTESRTILGWLQISAFNDPFGVIPDDVLHNYQSINMDEQMKAPDELKTIVTNLVSYYTNDDKYTQVVKRYGIITKGTIVKQKPDNEHLYVYSLTDKDTRNYNAEFDAFQREEIISLKKQLEDSELKLKIEQQRNKLLYEMKPGLECKVELVQKQKILELENSLKLQDITIKDLKTKLQISESEIKHLKDTLKAASVVTPNKREQLLLECTVNETKTELMRCKHYIKNREEKIGMLRDKLKKATSWRCNEEDNRRWRCKYEDTHDREMITVDKIEAGERSVHIYKKELLDQTIVNGKLKLENEKLKTIVKLHRDVEKENERITVQIQDLKKELEIYKSSCGDNKYNTRSQSHIEVTLLKSDVKNKVNAIESRLSNPVKLYSVERGIAKSTIEKSESIIAEVSNKLKVATKENTQELNMLGAKVKELLSEKQRLEDYINGKSYEYVPIVAIEHIMKQTHERFCKEHAVINDRVVALVMEREHIESAAQILESDNTIKPRINTLQKSMVALKLNKANFDVDPRSFAGELLALNVTNDEVAIANIKEALDNIKQDIVELQKRQYELINNIVKNIEKHQIVRYELIILKRCLLDIFNELKKIVPENNQRRKAFVKGILIIIDQIEQLYSRISDSRNVLVSVQNSISKRELDLLLENVYKMSEEIIDIVITRENFVKPLTAPQSTSMPFIHLVSETAVRQDKDMKVQLSKLREKIILLEDDNERLNELLMQNNAIEGSKLIHKIDILKTKIKSTDGKIESIEALNLSLQTQLESNKRIISSLTDRLNAKEDELKTVNTLVVQLKNNVSVANKYQDNLRLEKHQEIMSLQDELSETKEVLNNKKLEVNTLTSIIKDLELRIVLTDEDANTARGKIAETNIACKQLEDRVANFNDKIKYLEAEVNKMTKDNNELLTELEYEKKAVLDNSILITELKKQITVLETTNATFVDLAKTRMDESVLITSVSGSKELKDAFSTINKENSDLTVKIVRLQAELKSAEISKSEFINKAADANIKNKELLKERELMQMAVDNMAARIMSLEETNNGLNVSIDTIKNKNSIMNDEIKICELKLNKEQSRCKVYEDRINELKIEISNKELAFETEMEKINDSYKKEQQNNEQVQMLNEQYKAKIDELENTIVNAEITYNTYLKSVSKKFEDHINEVQNNVAQQYKEQVKDHNSEITKLRLKNTELVQTVSTLKKEYGERIKEFEDRINNLVEQLSDTEKANTKIITKLRNDKDKLLLDLELKTKEYKTLLLKYETQFKNKDIKYDKKESVLQNQLEEAFRKSKEESLMYSERLHTLENQYLQERNKMEVEFQNKLHKLESDNEKNVRKLENRLENFKHEYDNLKVKVTRADQLLKESENEIKLRDDRVRSMANQLDDTVEESLRAAKSENDLKKKMANLNQRLEEFFQKEVKLKNEGAAFKNTISEQNEQLQKQTLKIDQLNSFIKSYKDEIENYKSIISTLKMDMKVVQAQNSKMEQELFQERKDKNNEILLIRKKELKLESEQLLLENKNNALQIQIKELHTELNRKELDVVGKTFEIDTLTGKIESLVEKSKIDRKDMNKWKEENIQLNNSVTQKTIELSTLQEQFLMFEKSKGIDVIEMLRNENTALQNQWNALNIQIESQKTNNQITLTDLYDQIQTHKKEADELRIQVNDFKAEYENILNLYDESKIENDKVFKKQENLIINLKDSKEENSMLREKLKMAETQLDVELAKVNVLENVIKSEITLADESTKSVLYDLLNKVTIAKTKLNKAHSVTAVDEYKESIIRQELDRWQQMLEKERAEHKNVAKENDDNRLLLVNVQQKLSIVRKENEEYLTQFNSLNEQIKQERVNFEIALNNKNQDMKEKILNVKRYYENQISQIKVECSIISEKEISLLNDRIKEQSSLLQKYKDEKVQYSIKKENLLYQSSSAVNELSLMKQNLQKAEELITLNNKQQKEYEAKITSLENELINLREQLIGQISKEELKELKLNNLNLTANLLIETSKKNELETEIEKLKLRLEQEADIIQRQQEEVIEMRRTADAEKVIGVHSNVEIMKNVKELQSKLRSSVKETELLKKNKLHADKQIQKYIEQSNALNQEIAKLNKIIETYTIEIRKLKSQNRSAALEKEAAKSNTVEITEYVKLQKENKVLSKQLEDAKQHIKTLNKNSDSIAIDNLTRSLLIARNTIRKLTKSTSEAEGIEVETGIEIESSEENQLQQMETLVTENKSLKQQLKKMQDAENKVKVKFEKRVQELEHVLSNVNENEQTLKGEVNILAHEVQSLNIKIQELEQLLREKNKEIKRLEVIKTVGKRKYVTSATEIADDKTEIINKLTVDNEKLQNLLLEYEQDLEIVRLELENVQDKLNTYELSQYGSGISVKSSEVIPMELTGINLRRKLKQNEDEQPTLKVKIKDIYDDEFNLTDSSIIEIPKPSEFIIEEIPETIHHDPYLNQPNILSVEDTALLTIADNIPIPVTAKNYRQVRAIVNLELEYDEPSAFGYVDYDSFEESPYLSYVTDSMVTFRLLDIIVCEQDRLQNLVESSKSDMEWATTVLDAAQTEVVRLVSINRRALCALADTFLHACGVQDRLITAFRALKTHATIIEESEYIDKVKVVLHNNVNISRNFIDVADRFFNYVALAFESVSTSVTNYGVVFPPAKNIADYLKPVIGNFKRKKEETEKISIETLQIMLEKPNIISNVNVKAIADELDIEDTYKRDVVKSLMGTKASVTDTIQPYNTVREFDLTIVQKLAVKILKKNKTVIHNNYKRYYYKNIKEIVFSKDDALSYVQSQIYVVNENEKPLLELMLTVKDQTFLGLRQIINTIVSIDNPKSEFCLNCISYCALLLEKLILKNDVTNDKITERDNNFIIKLEAFSVPIHIYLQFVYLIEVISAANNNIVEWKEDDKELIGKIVDMYQVMCLSYKAQCVKVCAYLQNMFLEIENMFNVENTKHNIKAVHMLQNILHFLQLSSVLLKHTKINLCSITLSSGFVSNKIVKLSNALEHNIVLYKIIEKSNIGQLGNKTFNLELYTILTNQAMCHAGVHRLADKDKKDVLIGVNDRAFESFDGIVQVPSIFSTISRKICEMIPITLLNMKWLHCVCCYILNFEAQNFGLYTDFDTDSLNSGFCRMFYKLDKSQLSHNIPHCVIVKESVAEVSEKEISYTRVIQLEEVPKGTVCNIIFNEVLKAQYESGNDLSLIRAIMCGYICLYCTNRNVEFPFKNDLNHLSNFPSSATNLLITETPTVYNTPDYFLSVREFNCVHVSECIRMCLRNMPSAQLSHALYLNILEHTTISDVETYNNIVYWAKQCALDYKICKTKLYRNYEIQFNKLDVESFDVAKTQWQQLLNVIYKMNTSTLVSVLENGFQNKLLKIFKAKYDTVASVTMCMRFNRIVENITVQGSGFINMHQINEASDKVIIPECVNNISKHLDNPYLLDVGLVVLLDCDVETKFKYASNIALISRPLVEKVLGKKDKVTKVIDIVTSKDVVKAVSRKDKKEKILEQSIARIGKVPKESGKYGKVVSINKIFK